MHKCIYSFIGIYKFYNTHFVFVVHFIHAPRKPVTAMHHPPLSYHAYRTSPRPWATYTPASNYKKRKKKVYKGSRFPGLGFCFEGFSKAPLSPC